VRVKTNTEIERWFAQTKSPAEAELRRVREIILRADPRVTEHVKYGTVMFAYEGDFATFVQVQRRGVTLMLNRGSRIPGRFPHVEGDGPSARFMRFADRDEVESYAAELAKVVAAWCSLAPSMAKPKASATPKTRTKVAGRAAAAKSRKPKR
jgi:hypothetical protein